MDALPHAFRPQPDFGRTLQRAAKTTREAAQAERLRRAQEQSEEPTSQPRAGVASRSDTPIDPLDLVWRAGRDSEEFTYF